MNAKKYLKRLLKSQGSRYKKSARYGKSSGGVLGLILSLLGAKSRYDDDRRYRYEDDSDQDRRVRYDDRSYRSEYHDDRRYRHEDGRRYPSGYENGRRYHRREKGWKGLLGAVLAAGAKKLGHRV